MKTYLLKKNLNTELCFQDFLFLKVEDVFFLQAEDGIRDIGVTGVQTCALPIFEREVVGTAEGPLVGKRFVITGTLSSPRGHYVERIEAAGGTSTSSVSKNTDYVLAGEEAGSDRKSTRLNSSHANISYAVFCLKKKTLTHIN